MPGSERTPVDESDWSDTPVELIESEKIEEKRPKTPGKTVEPVIVWDSKINFKKREQGERKFLELGDLSFLYESRVW